MTYILLLNTSILAQFIIFFNYFLAKSLNPLPKAEWVGTAQPLQGPAWRILRSYPEVAASTHRCYNQPSPLCSKVMGGNLSPPHPFSGRRRCRFSAGSENTVTLCFNPVRGHLLLGSTGTHIALPSLTEKVLSLFIQLWLF